MDSGTVKTSVVTDARQVGDAILLEVEGLDTWCCCAGCSCPEDPGSACHACFQGNYRMGYRIGYSHHRGDDYGTVAESNTS